MIEKARAVAQRLLQRAKPIQTRIAEKSGDDLHRSYASLVTEGAATIDALVQEVERNLADHANIVQAYEDEIERLRRTLHNISLAAHDSGSTREGMGKEARAALEPLKPCTSDEWLANCPQSVRDLANKIKQEKK